METKTIVRVNNVDIIATSDEQMIAIRPICEALGIDADSQRKRIERDEILSPTAVMMTVVAADGKDREMYCIPYKYVFGWLFSIDTSRVNEEARPAVLRYKEECYEALYRHFAEPQTFLAEKQKVMERKVEEYQECQLFAAAELNQVMRVTIEEWRANNRQLILPFHSDEEE